MNEKMTNSPNNFEEDSIDIVALIKNIWSERKLITKVTISFFVIGCIVAILSPVVYTAHTTFVPQVSDNQMNNSSSLGALASSLAGINLNTNEVTTDSYLSPLLYTDIVDSEEFSLKLLEEELINSNADKFTIKEYFLSKESSFNFDPIGFIKKYTIGLFLNNEISEINSNIFKNYNFISDEDYYLLLTFRKKFIIELNEKQGYIKVVAMDENPFISSQFVDIITKNLQSKIIEIRTNKIKDRLEFSKEQYDLKQAEFDNLQKKLAEFKDSNKSISTARFMAELQKLESEYQLQQNILFTLASEYNNNKIKLNTDTPIFSVIDEVSVPNVRSKPKRGLLVIIYVFLGLVLSIGFVFGKEPVSNLIKEIKG
jgi:LPS O-antigen subunit length determinant protein (WzzB/FepE family)